MNDVMAIKFCKNSNQYGGNYEKIKILNAN